MSDSGGIGQGRPLRRSLSFITALKEESGGLLPFLDAGAVHRGLMLEHALDVLEHLSRNGSLDDAVRGTVADEALVQGVVLLGQLLQCEWAPEVRLGGTSAAPSPPHAPVAAAGASDVSEVSAAVGAPRRPVLTRRPVLLGPAGAAERGQVPSLTASLTPTTRTAGLALLREPPGTGMAELLARLPQPAPAALPGSGEDLLPDSDAGRTGTPVDLMALTRGPNRRSGHDPQNPGSGGSEWGPAADWALVPPSLTPAPVVSSAEEARRFT
jgi:hypothetical protein